MGNACAGGGGGTSPSFADLSATSLGLPPEAVRQHVRRTLSLPKQVVEMGGVHPGMMLLERTDKPATVPRARLLGAVEPTLAGEGDVTG